jgi:alpha-galactosidase
MLEAALIGAGSAIFARQLVTDVLAIDGLGGGTFALVNIGADQLKLAHDISEQLVEAGAARTRRDRRLVAGTRL